MDDKVSTLLVDEKVSDILKKIVSEIVYLDERELEELLKSSSKTLIAQVEKQSRTIDKMNQNVEHSLRPYAHCDASTSDQFVDLPFLEPVVFADDLACDESVDDDRYEVAPFLKTDVLRTPVVRYSQSNNTCTALRLHSSGIFQRGMCCMFGYGSHRKLGARITNIDERNETAATRNLRVHNWRRQAPVVGYQLLRSILRDVSYTAREAVTHDLSAGKFFDSDVRNKLVYTMMYMNYYNAVAYAFLTNTQ
eukprot:gene25977-31802_t